MAEAPLTIGATTAVDTNAIIRYILADDPGQLALVVQAIQEPVFVPDTVLMETVWVLSSRYDMPRSAIARELLAILDLPTVEVDKPDRIKWAVERFRLGADFADMMHLVAAERVGRLMTFDRALARAAGADAPADILTLRA